MHLLTVLTLVLATLITFTHAVDKNKKKHCIECDKYYANCIEVSIAFYPFSPLPSLPRMIIH